MKTSTSRESHQEKASPGANQEGSSRRLARLGIGLIVTGAVGVLASPHLGELLWLNYERLPQSLQDELYPDLYTLEFYRRLFHAWSLWPGMLLCLVGVGLALPALTQVNQVWWKLFTPTRVSIWTIIGVGVTFRVRALATERSLWLDEAVLALNIANRDLATLLTVPLDNVHSVPPGFLALVWFAHWGLGSSEWALRIIPFTASIAALFWAKVAAERLFESHLARSVFLALIAFSPVLVYYSQELKQYSFDVLATVAVLWMLANWNQQQNRWSFGLLGAILVQFSVTAVFSLVALGIAVISVQLNREKSIRSVAELVRTRGGVFVLWALGGILHGVYLLLAGTSMVSMQSRWLGAGGFAPSNRPADIPAWLFESLQQTVWLGLGHHAVGAANMAVPGVIGPLLLLLLVSGLILSTLGRVFAVSMLLVAILLSTLQLYPFFGGRVSLYLVPVLALIFAGTVQKLSGSGQNGARGSLRWLFASTVLISFAVSLVIFGRPEDKGDIAWLANEYETRRNGNTIFTLPKDPVSDWYRSSPQMDLPGFVSPSVLIDNPTDFAGKTIWVLVPHSSPEEIIRALNDTHDVECSTVTRMTEIHILTPAGSQFSREQLCQIAVPKA